MARFVVDINGVLKVNKNDYFGEDSKNFINERELFESTMMKELPNFNRIPWELIFSLKKALDKKIYSSTDDLSSSIKMDKSYIRKLIKILDLDIEIIREVEYTNSIKDIDVLYAIQQVFDKEEQIKIYFMVIAEKIDINALKKIAK